MRQRRYRERAIHVTVNVTTDSGRDTCPWCQERYDRTLPMLGAEGVDIAYVHNEGDGSTFHFANAVMHDAEHEVDSDAYCIYEVGGSDGTQPDTEGGSQTPAGA